MLLKPAINSEDSKSALNIARHAEIQTPYAFVEKMCCVRPLYQTHNRCLELIWTPSNTPMTKISHPIARDNAPPISLLKLSQLLNCDQGANAHRPHIKEILKLVLIILSIQGGATLCRTCVILNMLRHNEHNQIPKAIINERCHG